MSRLNSNGAAKRTDFDAVRHLIAQPPAVRALRNLPSGDERDARALVLAQGGAALDVPVMVWNRDPVTTTGVRQQLGFTWVPSAVQARLPRAADLTQETWA